MPKSRSLRAICQNLSTWQQNVSLFEIQRICDDERAGLV